MTAPDTVSLSRFLDLAAQAFVQRSGMIVAVVVGTLLALALLNVVASRVGLVDHPDGRRKRHRGKVPLTGGLAILCGIRAGSFAGTNSGTPGLAILVLLTILCAIHMIDDRSGLRTPNSLGKVTSELSAKSPI